MIADPASNFVVDDIGCTNAFLQITDGKNVIILKMIGSVWSKKCLNFCRVKLSAAVYPTISLVRLF
jgi:hypothetical protein